MTTSDHESSSASAFTVSTSTQEIESLASGQSLAGPWRRYFATSSDIALIGTLSLLVLAPVSEHLARMSLAGFLLLVLVIVPLVIQFLAAVIFRVAGNTPGKALFAVKVVRESGERPTFLQFAHRQLCVYLYGMWLGAPLLTLMAMLRQYRHVSTGRPATYDKDRFKVLASPFGTARIAILCLLGLSVVVSLSISGSKRTWTHPITHKKVNLPVGWKFAREIKLEHDGTSYVFERAQPDRQAVLMFKKVTDAEVARGEQDTKAKDVAAKLDASELKAVSARYVALCRSGLIIRRSPLS